MITDPAKAMEAQFWFASRLKESGVTVYFSGTHDVPSRWEIIRTAIVDFNFAAVVIPKTRETFGQAFTRATDLPLIQPKQETAA